MIPNRYLRGRAKCNLNIKITPNWGASRVKRLKYPGPTSWFVSSRPLSASMFPRGGLLERFCQQCRRIFWGASCGSGHWVWGINPGRGSLGIPRLLEDLKPECQLSRKFLTICLSIRQFLTELVRHVVSHQVPRPRESCSLVSNNRSVISRD
jgi:hypothetical protein